METLNVTDRDGGLMHITMSCLWK